MSTTLSHVAGITIKRGFFFCHSWHKPLNYWCSRFFRCKELLCVSLLYCSHTHYPLFPTADRVQIPLHVRTRRLQQWAIMPKFPEYSIFHKVYLGCHMQGQGLLTDMISLARGEGTHYPQTVWSSLHSFQTPLFVWCLELQMMIGTEMQCYWKERLLKLIDGDRTVAAESDDITPTGRLWEKTC